MHRLHAFQGQVPSAAAPITIPRPSDVYFGALTPALKEAVSCIGSGLLSLMGLEC